jgi:hypothetical protein
MIPSATKTFKVPSLHCPQGFTALPAESETEREGVLTRAEAAQELRVSREHLNRVLNGHRHSARLIARYRDLKKLKSLS